MKSGVQMMLESMIGPDGMKAVEECKRILPAVPQLVENLKTGWNDHALRVANIEKLLERVATQNNVILGKLEALGLKVDPSATEDMPPTLAHHLLQQENAEAFMSEIPLQEN